MRNCPICKNKAMTFMQKQTATTAKNLVCASCGVPLEVSKIQAGLCMLPLPISVVLALVAWGGRISVLTFVPAGLILCLMLWEFVLPIKVRGDSNNSLQARRP